MKYADILGGSAAIADEAKIFAPELVKQLSDSLSASLAELGVGQGQVVAVSQDRGADALVAVLAIMKAGAAFSCLDAGWHEDARLERLVHLGASALVTCNGDGTFHSASLRTTTVPRLTEKDLAYVVFTSGTTGRPKAIGVSRQALHIYLNAICERLGGQDVIARKRVASVSSLGADLGYTTVFLGLVSADLILLPSHTAVRDPYELGRLLRASAIEVLKITPSHLREALRHTDVLPRELLILGGEPLARNFLEEIKARAPQLVIFNHYGPAETCVGVAARRVDTLTLMEPDCKRSEVIPVGHALSPTILRVVGTDGATVSDGQEGELEVEGPTVADGYLDHRSGYDSFLDVGTSGFRRYRTGDRARFTENGFEILGRIDRQLKIAGQRVEPAGVEAVLRQCTGIADCVVGGRLSPEGQLSLLAWVIPEDGYDEAILRTALNRRLGPNSQPDFLIPVEEFGRTSSGKVDAMQLPSPGNWKPIAPAVAPGTALERLLFHASHLFGFPGNSHRSFLDFGMRSLDALRLAANLRKEGWQLGIEPLFSNGPPTKIAEKMTRLQSAPEPASKDARRATAYEQSLWFASLASPGRAYTLTVLLEVRAANDTREVAQAWEGVLSRRANLRMRMVETIPLTVVIDGTAVQVNITPPFSCDESSPEEAALAAAREFLRNPLDLTQALAQSTVIAVRPGIFLIALLVHHVICDGLSVEVLINSLVESLAAEEKGGDASFSLSCPGLVSSGQGVSRVFPYSFQKTFSAAVDRWNVTPFVFMVAAWGATLSTLETNEFPIIATPVSIREADEWDTVGCYVNTVLIPRPTDLSVAPEEFFQAVQACVLVALEQRKVPFSELARQKAFRGRASMVTLEQRFSHTHGNVSVRRLRSELGAATFPLDCCLVHDEFGSEAVLYASDKSLSVEQLETLLERFEWIVTNLSRGQLARFDDALTLPTRRAQELLGYGSGIRIEHEFRGLADGIIDEIQRNPDALRLLLGDCVLPLTALDCRSRQWVSSMKAQHFSAGSIVGVDLRPGLEQLAALFAVVRLGAVPLALDPAWPMGRKRRFGQEATGLISDDEALVGALRPPPQNAPLDFSARHVAAPDEVAYLVGTSGSTGAPKLIPLTHGSLCNHFGWMQRVRPLCESDKVLVWTTPCFDVGIWERFAPLACGSTAAIMEGLGARDPLSAATMVVQHGVTLLQTTPSLLRALCLHAGFVDFDSRLDIFCGGEPLTQELVDLVHQSMKHVRLGDAYGPAEATIDVLLQIDTSLTRTRSTFSHVVDNCDVAVVKSGGHLCNFGEPGRLAVAGQGLPLACHNDTRMSSDFVEFSFAKGRQYFLTGDRASWRRDGSLVLMGRVDRCIKLRGERMELDEIEAILGKCPGVREVAVATEGDFISAYVAAENSCSLDELADCAALLLPRTFVPQRWARLPSLLRTASGKIDRRAMMEIKAFPLIRQGKQAETEIQRAVAKIWDHLLSQKCGVDVGFFEAGGSSLMLLQLRGALTSRFGVELSIPQLFAAPTIRLQADLLSGSATVSPESSQMKDRRGSLAELARRRQITHES